MTPLQCSIRPYICSQSIEAQRVNTHTGFEPMTSTRESHRLIAMLLDHKVFGRKKIFINSHLYLYVFCISCIFLGSVSVFWYLNPMSHDCFKTSRAVQGLRTFMLKISDIDGDDQTAFALPEEAPGLSTALSVFSFFRSIRWCCRISICCSKSFL